MLKGNSKITNPSCPSLATVPPHPRVKLLYSCSALPAILQSPAMTLAVPGKKLAMSEEPPPPPPPVVCAPLVASPPAPPAPHM